MKEKLLVTIFALLLSYSGKTCTNLMITPGASADGSAIVSYAADSHVRYGTLLHIPAATHAPGTMRQIYQWGTGKYLGEIPQVERTYSVIGNMNEHQVVIGETTWTGEEICRDPDGMLDWGSLIYIALERSKTAREAIKVITSLTDQYGYVSSGETFSISDPNEVWIMDIISRAPKMVDGKNVNKGMIWVAIKIPDGAISAHANQARITSIPFNDSENCLYSPDIVSHAREIGLFKGKDSQFNFARTYGAETPGKIRSCDARVWSFFNKWAKDDMSRYLPYALGDPEKERMPLYLLPKRKLTVIDVAEMMRDHYEGTPMDMIQDIGAGGNELPYRWRPTRYEVDGKTYTNERPIAIQATGFWFVAQSRRNFPNSIGGVFWFGVDDAATSPLTPFYTSSTAISNHYAVGNGSMVRYSPTSMFWLTNRIAQFAYLRYNHIGKEVQEIIREHEAKAVEEVKMIDNVALQIAKENPNYLSQFLTNYSVNSANTLFQKWKKLDEYLLIKYMDGYTKFQNEDGSFTTNQWCDSVPVPPEAPGYTDLWKKSVIESTGNRLLLK